MKKESAYSDLSRYYIQNKNCIMRIFSLLFFLSFIIGTSARSLAMENLSVTLINDQNGYSLPKNSIFNLSLNVSCNSDFCEPLMIGLLNNNYDFAYLSTGGRGLDTYVRDKQGQLSFLYNYPTGDFSFDNYDVWGDGKFIYLASGVKGIKVFSKLNGQLNLMSNVNTLNLGLVYDVWGDGKFIYTADGENGIYVFSVNESGNLTLLDNDYWGGSAESVWGDGKFIYTADDNGGLLVYSVDDLGQLTFLGSYLYGNYVHSVWGDGKFIYTADDSYGIEVFSVNESGNLTLLSNFNDFSIYEDEFGLYQGGYAYDVWGDGKFIYTADGERGIEVFSVNESGQLTLIYNAPRSTPYSESNRIVGDSEYIYSSNGCGGIDVYSVNESGQLTLLDNDYIDGYDMGIFVEKNKGLLINSTSNSFYALGDNSIVLNLSSNQSEILTFSINISSYVADNITLSLFYYPLSNITSLKYSENISIYSIDDVIPVCNNCTVDPISGGGGGGGSTKVINKILSNNTAESCIYDPNFDWHCGNWSICIDGIQKRVCKEKNNCGNIIGTPNLLQICNTSISNPKNLFDIILRLDKNKVENMSDFGIIVSFNSFGTEPTPVDLTYTILDSSGKEIYNEKDNITVTTEQSLKHNFKELNLKEGNYTFILNTLYGSNVSDDFRQPFSIGKNINQKNNVYWIYYTIAIAIILIIIILFILLKIKKRK